jgi:protein TonB
MEAKKSPKADLEKKKTIFVQIGLIIALGVIFGAFEWKTYEKQELQLIERVAKEVIQEEIIQTKQEVKPPPPPPPKTVTVLNIVEDDVEIEDDIEIDAEADMETEVEEYIPVEMEDDEIQEAEIFTVVESMPKFPGGPGAMNRYLGKNIEYPQMARESGINGRVFVTFVVETDGRVTDIKVLRGIGGGCDEEAVRVVKNMPKWDPGKQRGKPVRVQFNLPIKFTLQ